MDAGPGEIDVDVDCTVALRNLTTLLGAANANSGSGAICEARAYRRAVISAKAGIHPACHWKQPPTDWIPALRVDKLRGNDWCFEREPIPNNTTKQLAPL